MFDVRYVCPEPVCPEPTPKIARNIITRDVPDKCLSGTELRTFRTVPDANVFNNLGGLSGTFLLFSQKRRKEGENIEGGKVCQIPDAVPDTRGRNAGTLPHSMKDPAA